MANKLIYQDMWKMLEGNHTLDSIIGILNKNGINADRQKAIYVIHRLKKKGYVKTKYLSNKKRVYNISFENSLGGVSYYDIINEISPIKLSINKSYIIHKKNKPIEEAFIYAIKKKEIRPILASISLFKKIKNWSLLYHLSKKENLERQVGALYDVSRLIMKTRKMTKRFRNLSLPKKQDKFQYIIEGISSRDFQRIENIWKVHIPFNLIDLEDYR